MKLSEFEALCNKATREWHSGYVPVNEHTHWQSVGPVTFGMQQAISDAAFADAARTMAHKLIGLLKIALDVLACDEPIFSAGKWDLCGACPACHFFETLAEMETR